MGHIFTAKARKNIKVFNFFIISLVFVAIAASIAVIGCNYFANRNFKETFYSVSSLKVNNTVRVIQISDLHECTYGEANTKLIDRVGKLEPDLILLTGDCMNGETESPDQIVTLCGALAKIAPSYYIYGNNEVERYYGFAMTQEAIDGQFGFDDATRDPGALLAMRDPLTEQLEAAGVTVLKNGFATLTVGDTPVDVYGVLTSNPSSFWSYAGESFDGYIYSNENNLKITAIHEPAVFEEYTPEFWGDVLFAGHTHGGLVKVPVLGALYTPEAGLFPGREGHFVYGRYEVQGRPLIVSGGMENQNIFRINNEPEMVIVDINKF